jgi:hypothetical protein
VSICEAAALRWSRCGGCSSEDDLRLASDDLRTLKDAVEHTKTESRASKSGERDALMGGRSDGSGYGGAGDMEPLSAEMVVSRQEAQMRDQDRLLGDMEEGLDRLHKTNTGMKEELAYQDKLIDDTADAMDTAESSLRSQTRRIVRIMQANGVCWMYIVILLLLGLLIVLIATASF